MKSGLKSRITQARQRVNALRRRLRGNEAGATAIEFAILGLPFVMLLFGTMSAALYFFTNVTVASALVDASRALRTGQFQESTGAYDGAITLQQREQVFKSAMCAKLPPYVDCSRIVIRAQSNANFGGISRPVCATGGVMVTQATADATFATGGASAVVLVTACYPWNVSGGLPFLNIGNLSDGSFLILTSVVFRTEPYN
jgi:Flp pilus assembly protein TadG